MRYEGAPFFNCDAKRCNFEILNNKNQLAFLKRLYVAICVPVRDDPEAPQDREIQFEGEFEDRVENGGSGISNKENVSNKKCNIPGKVCQFEDKRIIVLLKFIHLFIT